MTDSTDNKNNLPIIGILGDGQLAEMMSRAYQNLGGQVWVFAASLESPAAPVADNVVVGSTSEQKALDAFFEEVDVVTLENEFLSREQLQAAVNGTSTPLFPEPQKFGLIEDKLSEKQFFEKLGVPVAPYFEITSENDLVDEAGFIKIAKGGYDGIGTYHVKNLAEASDIYNRVKDSGVLLFERAIEFDKELSSIAVRGVDGLEFYPLVETHQESGTCRYVSFPAGVSENLEHQAREYVGLIMEELNTRGVFAFEFFVTKDQQLIINESAPRPHNSGHISLDLYNVSQFENHMRAIAGLPLVQPQANKDSALMVNLLASKNEEFPASDIAKALAGPQQNLKLYGKRMARPKRKMGHINLWGDDQWRRARDIVDTLDI